MIKKASGLLCFILLTAGIFSLHTQAQDKQQLTPADYAQWQRIYASELSDDGKWFSWQIAPVEGDGWLMIKATAGGEEHKFMHASLPEFSSDNKWFAFRIGLSEKERNKLQKQKKPVRYSLGLMNLATARTDTFENIQSFSFTESGSHLLMKKYKAEEVKTKGTDLIVRRLSSQSNQLYGNVADYALNDAGTHLAMLLDASDKLGNGVHLLDLNNNSLTVLDSDEEDYTALSWHDEKNALAFMKSSSDTAYTENTHSIYAFPDATHPSKRYVFNQGDMDAFPEHMRVVDFAGLQWSDDLKSVFFGIKDRELKQDAPKDTSAIAKLNEDLDPTNVEVWHWKDAEIQPQQEVRKSRNEKMNMLSVWHPEDNSFVQLQDESMNSIRLSGDQQYAVAYVSEPYEPAFRESWNDVYAINTRSGERTKVLERHESVSISPGGKYLLYFKDNNWWTYSLKENKHTNITGKVNTRFENHKNITGRENFRPHGTGQWSEGDRWLLVYDEFDVYKVKADGSGAENLTNGADDKIRYRQHRWDYEKDELGRRDDIYLSIFAHRSKERGYARLNKGSDLQQLLFGAAQFSRLAKAENADAFVFMKESAVDSPDFFLTGSGFSNQEQLTNTNPQQDEYHWAGDELVTFTNTRGDTLHGRLLYPADYEEGKSYPMITYIYEMRSQNMHSYSIPTRTSPYNMRRYSSEGYFVFEPDINYMLRDPGVSAVQSVVPAVEKVLAEYPVNKDQVGLTGHSWGAYQTAFIITQTDIFNSAVAGAPLTNMVSMYGSVYWNSGTPDAQIFEISQGRFPDPYWEDWDKFIENSPIFNMENNTTPLLVEFGTDDGAVDFNQGVELYTTMRRMEKPYVMLVYEGENHGLRRKENQIDYATRAFQWHEHYLLGKEAPEWISSGIPYLKRPEILEKEDK